MISILYGIAIVVLYWTTVGLLLYKYYSHKYRNTADAEFNLDRDMRTWAPAIGIFLVIVLPEYSLMWLTGIGVCFEAYLTYTDEDTSIAKIKRFLGGDTDV
jgi:hypothetical protein